MLCLIAGEVIGKSMKSSHEDHAYQGIVRDMQSQGRLRDLAIKVREGDAEIAG